MLEVTALPASFGDCLWIEYGCEHNPSVVLIDGGISISTEIERKLTDLASKNGKIELAVVTHIDRDHIAGMIELLRKNFFGVPVLDFWFNGLRHLSCETFSEKQGEQLTKLILDRGLAWNKAFDSNSISVNSKTENVTLPGGAIIQLLSPDDGQLDMLRKGWIEVCEKAGLYEDPFPEQLIQSEMEGFGAETYLDIDALADTPFEEDSAKANGSSIAFVFTYENQRILFGADAFPSRLLESLKKIDGNAPYKFDLVKLPHHGSKANVSTEFIKALQSPRYLFCSNGKIHGHPCPEAVARVIRHGQSPELIFNYQTKKTTPWSDSLLCHQYGHRFRYGEDGYAMVKLS